MNIYHCCIQKSGSRWIKRILGDPLVQEKTGLKIYTPEKDFILAGKNRKYLQKGFPLNSIISPLYVMYNDFLLIPKVDTYKAFWVMRDPRDIIISRYFSMKYSHAILNEYHAKERAFLNEVGIEQGINYYIEKIPTIHARLYSSMTSWLKSSNNPAVIICKYEDLISMNQLDSFRRIFNHCHLEIPEHELKKLLNKYSFNKLAEGRKQGEEDPESHYRKGIAGDWKNYFSDNHKRSFKKVTGQLLVELGYEKNDNW